jgi:hypothetical protein
MPLGDRGRYSKRGGDIAEALPLANESAKRFLWAGAKDKAVTELRQEQITTRQADGEEAGGGAFLQTEPMRLHIPKVMDQADQMFFGHSRVAAPDSHSFRHRGGPESRTFRREFL